ncbi:hypothetical protein ACFV9W_36935 [Streptomyces sp. NPDC059897]|uniref:hypothetical protein n=1 Tax=Streptomyces sp. NPDC059897 TaxID=3346994 RepID=UPI0036478093
MSAVNTLLHEIQTLLAGPGVSYTSASQPWDVYEGYLFSLATSTASSLGASVHYRDVDGNTVNSLVFRTSPGQLYSTTHPYTHAVVEFDRAPALEVHLGVQVQGNSGVLHECDVLILPADEAALSRQIRMAPRGNKCLLAIECKYYTASRVGIGHARNFEGLHSDLRTARNLFVSNTGASSVVKYLSARKRGYEREVVPANVNTVGYTRGQIREAFKIYLGKTAPSTVI